MHWKNKSSMVKPVLGNQSQLGYLKDLWETFIDVDYNSPRGVMFSKLK